MSPGIDLEQVENKIYDLFTKFAGKDWPIVWRDRGGARIGKNFVSLKIISGPSKVGNDDLVMEGTTQYVNGMRSILLSVQAFGKGSRTFLTNFVAFGQFPAWVAECGRLGLGQNNIPQVLDITEILDTNFEERMAADFGFYIGFQTRTDETWIEKFELAPEEV